MKLGRYLLFALLAMMTVSCAQPDDEYEVREQALAVAGAWQIPSSIVSQADSYAIGYTGAGPWVGTSGCSGYFTDGAQMLRNWVLSNWSQVTQVGGYSCRAIVGNSSAMSVHGTGRAIDIHIPLDNGEADNGLGDPLANYLVEHADELGIQMVIWDRWMWSPSRSPRSRPYNGQHPHHDHLHVEITPEAARKGLPWYQGGASAPQAGNCDPVPSAGRVIDDTDSCFVAFGPSQYWRRVSSGMGGSLLWTDAYSSNSPSNWARWNVDIQSEGMYVVEYYRTGSYAMFDSTRYRVRAGGVETDIYLDQSAGTEGWEEIGTFSFSGGANQWVAVYDNTPGSVADGQHIVVDALRIRPVGSNPPAPPVNTGGGSTGDGSTGDGSTGSTGDGSTGSTGDGSTGDGSTGDGSTGDSSGGAGGTSDLPTGAQVDLGNDDENEGAAPGNYGTGNDDVLPPKGSQPVEEEHWHDAPEIVEEDTPPSVYLEGHSCSTAAGAGDSLFGLLVALGLIGRRRR